MCPANPPFAVHHPMSLRSMRYTEGVKVSSDTKVSARERLGRWFDKNRTGLAFGVTGLLIGLGAGWWVGGFLSCSRATNGCEVRATSIGAAGTWFGAIGTVAAVLTAVAAFRAGERHKREEERLALLSDIEREISFAHEASRVSINCPVDHKQGARILGYVVSITNGADQTPIYRLQGRDFTGPLKGAHELGGGQSASTTRHAGSWSAPPEVPVDNQGAFEQWCVSNVTIMFKMNGRYWRRTGHRDAELIDSWDAEGPESPPW